MVNTAPEQARDIPRFMLEGAGVPHNTIVRNLSPGVISGLINLLVYHQRVIRHHSRDCRW